MRNIPGTITDPNLDHVIPNTRADLEKSIASFDVIGLDEYQEYASETAIYPRVYTEDQVKEIVLDVVIQWADEIGQPDIAYIMEDIEEALIARETPFNRLVYPILGLVGEAGEISNKLKKIARDKKGKMDVEAVEDTEKELGDVFWYVSAIATELKTKLSYVASENVAKLFSRKERGVLSGSGDNR